MKRHIEFTRQPIVAPPTALDSKEIGAQVEFHGVVRELENGKSVPGLFYEAHESMARKELEKILTELSSTHRCAETWFIHRLGFVPVGEASLFIRVQSQHRQAALQLVAALIDRLKSEVPVWKSAGMS
jgi:molybdopterin synthase catalytic subunit